MTIFNILKNIVRILPGKANGLQPQLTSGSLNNIKKNGWYWVRSDGTVTDMPENTFGVMEVVNFLGTTNVMQRFSVFDSRRVYERMYINSKWYDWYQISGHDTVVGYGTSNSWTYRKWSSGVAECWRRINLGSIKMTSSYANGHYYNQVTAQSFPSNLFTDTPSVVGNVTRQSGLCFISFYNLNKTSTQFYIASSREETTAVSTIINLYAVGKWK